MPADAAWFLGIGAFYTDFAQTSDDEVQRLLADTTQEVTAVAAAASADPDSSDPARDVEVAGDGVRLPGNLAIPEDCIAAVIFAHGSGSSRFSPRNTAVARRFNGAGLATLLFDLLTPTEALDRANVFEDDITVSYKQGILEIRVPMPQPPQPEAKKIRDHDRVTPVVPSVPARCALRRPDNRRIRGRATRFPHVSAVFSAARSMRCCAWRWSRGLTGSTGSEIGSCTIVSR